MKHGQTKQHTAHLEIRRVFDKPHNALHSVREALGAELSQDDGQDGMMIAGQKMLIHALACVKFHDNRNVALEAFERYFRLRDATSAH